MRAPNTEPAAQVPWSDEGQALRAGLEEIYVAEAGSGSDLATNIAAGVASFTASAGATSLVVRLLGRAMWRRLAGGR